MVNIQINTDELNNKILKIDSMLSELDNILEEIDSKLKGLSYNNHNWYSMTTIHLYDHFNEQLVKIKQLHDSYKSFFKSTNFIIEEYEDLEKSILKRVENISSIHIV